MKLKHLPFLFILLLAGCDSDDADSTGIVDCRTPTRACGAGAECLEGANGVYSCIRITVGRDMGPGGMGGNGGTGGAGGGGMGGAGGQGAAGGGMATTPDCETVCREAIECLYATSTCRQLTPGEERDTTASCVTNCNAGAIDRAALTGVAECEPKIEAALAATPDLATLCGISALDQPCRTSAGDRGICVAAAACDSGGDESRCLGAAVCCAGISCQSADGSEGQCIATTGCQGRLLQAECPGVGTGCCVPFSPNGGACTNATECASGICATEMSAGRPTPGGLCEQECMTSEECGDGSTCVGSGAGGLCLETCGANTPCREGWVCGPQRQADENGNLALVTVCLPNCNEAGCGQEGICNTATGVCEFVQQPPPGCPYDCQPDEECVDERCVRADGSCAGDYNCPQDQRCSNGTCLPDSFAECVPNRVNECAPDMTCVATQNGGGLCLFTCATSAECPTNFACRDIGLPTSVCYYQFCAANEVNGRCDFEIGSSGTCRSLPAGSAEPGICFNAGTAPIRGECDGEANPALPVEAELACSPGSLCFGDPDDPLDPQNQNLERGICRPLCQVGGQDCIEGEACVNLGELDNPATMEDETWNLGVCFESECALFDGSCGEEQTCQPLAFGSNFGECRAAGALGLGELCETNEDCGPNTICGNAGSGSVCIAFCQVGRQECPWGQSCVAIGGGAVGACL